MPCAAYLSSMNDAAQVPPRPPMAYTRRRPDGSWSVAVSWQNGRQEEVGPYKTASEAEACIKQQLDAWHEGNRALARKVRPLAGAK